MQHPPVGDRVIGSAPSSSGFRGRWPLVALATALWAVFAIVIGPWLIGLAFGGQLPLSDSLLRSKGDVSLDRYLEAWRVAALGSTAVGATAFVILWTHHRHTPWALRVAFVVSLIVGRHFATLRGPEPLGSDASLYLLHARNLVEGRPYAETGYVLNPTRPEHSPQAYPPVLATLIAPIWAVRGMDIPAIKLALHLVLAVLLVCVAGLARQFVSPTLALAVAGLVGFSAVTKELKDGLGSDISFVAFSCAALWLAERSVRRSPSLVPWWHGAYLGALVFLATASRTIGIALIPAVLLAEILNRRRITAFAVAFVAACGTGLWLQGALGMSAFGYANAKLATPLGALRASVHYFRQMGEWAFGAVPDDVRPLSFGVGLLLVVAGVASRANCFRSPSFLFTGAYLTLLSLWAGFDPRYVFPLFPLVLTAGVAGAVWLTGRKPVTKWLVVVPLAASAVGSSLRASVVASSPVELSFTDPAVTEAMSFLKASTVEQDIIVFNAPRTLALLARRRSLAYDSRLDDRSQWRFLDSVGVTHALLHSTARGDSAYLLPFLQRATHRARPVFTNDEFTVFELSRSSGSTVP